MASRPPESAQDESGGTRPPLSSVEPVTSGLYLLVTGVTLRLEPVSYPQALHISNNKGKPSLGRPLCSQAQGGRLLLGWSRVLYSALRPGPWSPKPPCGLLGPVVLGFISPGSLARLSALHANPCDRPHSDTSPGSEKKARPQPWPYSGSRWKEAGGVGPDPEKSRSLTPAAAGKVKEKQQRSAGPASESLRNPSAP